MPFRRGYHGDHLVVLNHPVNKAATNGSLVTLSLWRKMLGENMWHYSCVSISIPIYRQQEEKIPPLGCTFIYFMLFKIFLPYLSPPGTRVGKVWIPFNLFGLQFL